MLDSPLYSLQCVSRAHQDETTAQPRPKIRPKVSRSAQRVFSAVNPLQPPRYGQVQVYRGRQLSRRRNGSQATRLIRTFSLHSTARRSNEFLLCKLTVCGPESSSPTWTSSPRKRKDKLARVTVSQHPFRIQEPLRLEFICVRMPSFVA